MSRDDWFRNATWNSEIEEAFRAKLRRALNKNQYLRIQASYLTASHPDVSLRLLEEYFALGDYFDHAQANVDRAEAHLAMGNLDAAIASYEEALVRESVRPKWTTLAHIELPYLIATRGAKPYFNRAVELLTASKSRLMFPVDHFKWHAAFALIALAKAEAQEAKTYARNALVAAGIRQSGFRNHPKIGLVGDTYNAVCKILVDAAT